MIGEVRVKTITYGRKLPIEKCGNAEYILTAEVKPEQTPEEVMASLRKIVDCQLAEAANDATDRYKEVV